MTVTLGKVTVRLVVICASFKQSANALSPISLRLVLKSIVVMLAHPENAEEPTLITPDGIEMPLREEHPEKQLSGISDISDGILTLISFEHPEKHAVPIDATESGIEIVTTCVLP